MSRKDIIKHKKGEVIHDAKIDEAGTNFTNYKIILAIIISIVTIFSILFL